MDMSNIINQMIELFIIISIGFIANKTNIMNEDINKGLSKIILYISLPAMVIAAVLNNDHMLSNKDVLTLLMLSLFMYLFLIFVAFIFGLFLRVPKERKGIYKFLIIFGNIGFMGFPVVNAIFGSNAVFYASIFQVPFCFLSYTIGTFLIAGKEKMPPVWKAFLQPGVISAVLALILYLCNVHLPAFISQTVECVGKITTPGSMLIIGSTIATYSLKKAFCCWRIYPLAIIKQILVPYLFWLILVRFQLDPLMLGVTVVMIAMPCATNSTILCHEYDGDTELSAAGVFITTLLSCVTIPLLSYFLLR